MGVGMSIADWLLEQIAADEGEANYLANTGVQGTQYGSVNTALSHVIDIVRQDAEARRRIVELHGWTSWSSGSFDVDLCNECRDQKAPCPTLKLLALPYADRAGYEEAWRP